MNALHHRHSTLHLPRADQDGVKGLVERGTAVAYEMTKTLVARAEYTCGPSGDDKCVKPTSSTNSQTLPIALGVVIPLTCALCVFYWLHRKNKKKQALEDINDPHKSLDFGLDMEGGIRKPRKARLGKRGHPEMADIEISDPMRPGKKTRGLSMDMLGSPYLLPAGLNGSHESLHSTSRLQDEHDPYRQVALMRSSTETSRSPRPFHDNGSMYSNSTLQTYSNEKSNLVSNGQPMSHAYPRRGDSMNSDHEAKSPQDGPVAQMHSSRSYTPSRKSSLATPTTSLPNIQESAASCKQSLPPLPSPPEQPASQMSFYTPPEKTEDEVSFQPRTNSVTRPPRKDSAGAGAAMQNIDRHMSDASFYGDDIPPLPPPKIMEPEGGYYDEPDMMYSGRFSIDTPAPSQQYPVQDNRMSMMGLRPLPPDDMLDNPEQRANRIRSFYKEYFDVNRPNPSNGHYEEDWDANYYGMYADDGAVYDPETGEYFTAPQAPFAQPMGRRAMTPPPRGAPRFGTPDHHYRTYSTMSAGGGPRGRPGPRAPPKKKLPPPKTLNSLPTPHMLKADAALFNAADFAPPTSFREQQNGRRPDSPAGIQRPYSPAVRAYSPLVSSFDSLNALPSPHLLRKSGTFTSLDFAPPTPKFQGQEGTASDAGSIRSARSGNISAMQVDAVRAGAYRVSRIPKEFVTSREDLSTQLRPKMNLISPA